MGHRQQPSVLAPAQRKPAVFPVAVRRIEHGQRQGIEQHRRRLGERHAVFGKVRLRLDRASGRSPV